MIGGHVSESVHVSEIVAENVSEIAKHVLPEQS